MYTFPRLKTSLGFFEQVPGNGSDKPFKYSPEHYNADFTTESNKP